MKTFSLSIPKPCPEKWENFTPTTDGGFCGSCSKVVIDFTKMTDEQVIDFIKQKPSHVCGRFRQNQLKAYHQFEFSKVKPGYMFLKAGVLSALLLFTSKPSTASNNVVDPPKTVQASSSVAELEIEPTLGGYKIRGVVLAEEDKLPIPGVNVVVKGSIIGVVTDADGYFELPGEFQEGTEITFAFIGYTTQNYVVSKSSGDSIKIVMIMDVQSLGGLVITGMVGEVSVTNIYKEESRFRSFWAKVKTWL